MPLYPREVTVATIGLFGCFNDHKGLHNIFVRVLFPFFA